MNMRENMRGLGLLCVALFLIFSRFFAVPPVVLGMLCGLVLVLVAREYMSIAQVAALRKWKRRVVKR